MRRPRSTRPDANQAHLIQHAEALGMSVQNTSALGGEVLDLLVGAFGVDVQVEVKDPLQPRSKRALTEGEQRTFDSWRGAAPHLWESELDVERTRAWLMGQAVAGQPMKEAG